jgi:hypothetical protein
MRPLAVLSRFGRRSTLSPTTTMRVEVRPPSLRHAPDSAWARMMFWLLAPAPAEASPPQNRLPAVRLEFMRAIADVDSADAEMLRSRIALSRSLRELWHLRSELYRVVGVAHSQREAETRLTLLNRHFPTRAPRTTFGIL